ncbi:MAG: hypothetical protein Q7T71_17695 [Herbiconiux sp.]|nr:hypothetical protein [Herbiconiux sp.]
MRVIEDVVELVGLADLSDVFLYEERGRRIEQTLTGDEDGTEPLIRSVMGISGLEAQEAHGLGFRFRMIFDDRRGNEFVADFQARYALGEECIVPEEIRAEFAERVAFFAVYPYLRASLQMTASRMSVPAPVLSMVRAGEFKLGDHMNEADVAENFEDNVPE